VSEIAHQQFLYNLQIDNPEAFPIAGRFRPLSGDPFYTSRRSTQEKPIKLNRLQPGPRTGTGVAGS
jgi:hypothetical protein